MDAGTAGFTTYMKEQPSPDPLLPSQHSIPIAPNCDTLSNQYVRVVHTNGIHHIALVTCTCQGEENITTDLIYAGWVPTSFVRVRTIFTAAILNHFCYCNLEMRFQLINFSKCCDELQTVSIPQKWSICITNYADSQYFGDG